MVEAADSNFPESKEERKFKPEVTGVRDIVSSTRNKIIGSSQSRSEQEKMLHDQYRETALWAVGMDGMALESYPGLQDDLEIVLTAVNQNPEASAFISARMTDNEDVFKVAIKGSEYANMYFTRRLRFKYGFIG
jgi:hypothetical protein